jgi:hypothetical protein
MAEDRLALGLDH